MGEVTVKCGVTATTKIYMYTTIALIAFSLVLFVFWLFLVLVYRQQVRFGYRRILGKGKKDAGAVTVDATTMTTVGGETTEVSKMTDATSNKEKDALKEGNNNEPPKDGEKKDGSKKEPSKTDQPPADAANPPPADSANQPPVDAANEPPKDPADDKKNV